MENALYVKCGSPPVQESEQDNQTAYNIVLIIVGILVVLILAVVIPFLIHKYYKRRKQSTEK